MGFPVHGAAGCEKGCGELSQEDWDLSSSQVHPLLSGFLVLRGVFRNLSQPLAGAAPFYTSGDYYV